MPYTPGLRDPVPGEPVGDFVGDKVKWDQINDMYRWWLREKQKVLRESRELYVNPISKETSTQRERDTLAKLESITPPDEQGELFEEFAPLYDATDPIWPTIRKLEVNAKTSKPDQCGLASQRVQDNKFVNVKGGIVKPTDQYAMPDPADPTRVISSDTGMWPLMGQNKNGKLTIANHKQDSLWQFEVTDENTPSLNAKLLRLDGDEFGVVDIEDPSDITWGMTVGQKGWCWHIGDKFVAVSAMDTTGVMAFELVASQGAGLQLWSVNVLEASNLDPPFDAIGIEVYFRDAAMESMVVPGCRGVAVRSDNRHPNTPWEVVSCAQPATHIIVKAGTASSAWNNNLGFEQTDIVIADLPWPDQIISPCQFINTYNHYWEADDILLLRYTNYAFGKTVYYIEDVMYAKKQRMAFSLNSNWPNGDAGAVRFNDFTILNRQVNQDDEGTASAPVYIYDPYHLANNAKQGDEGIIDRNLTNGQWEIIRITPRCRNAMAEVVEDKSGAFTSFRCKLVLSIDTRSVDGAHDISLDEILVENYYDLPSVVTGDKLQVFHSMEDGKWYPVSPGVGETLFFFELLENIPPTGSPFVVACELRSPTDEITVISANENVYFSRDLFSDYEAGDTGYCVLSAGDYIAIQGPCKPDSEEGPVFPDGGGGGPSAPSLDPSIISP